jgi:hypothetical protein
MDQDTNGGGSYFMKGTVFLPEFIMRGRRLVVAHETLLEIRSDEPIAQILFSNFERSRHCDVGVIGK